MNPVSLRSWRVCDWMLKSINGKPEKFGYSPGSSVGIAWNIFYEATCKLYFNEYTFMAGFTANIEKCKFIVKKRVVFISDTHHST